jgi:hypothetical protein
MKPPRSKLRGITRKGIVCETPRFLTLFPLQVSALRADFARPSYAWRSSNLALKAILSARVVSWAVPHPRSLQRLGGYRAGDHNARA